MVVPFYCVKLKGRMLTDELRRVLLRTAWEMIANQRARQEVGGREHSYEGHITTRNFYASIGGLAGMVFYATVCSNDSGDVEVDYLAPPADFEAFLGDGEDDAPPDFAPEGPSAPFDPSLN